MPYDEFDAEDPLELVGCEVALEEKHLTEMAECFIQEYFRMGYAADSLLALFRNPFYRGPHSIYLARGDRYVRELIGEIVGEQPSASVPAIDLVQIQPRRTLPTE